MRKKHRREENSSRSSHPLSAERGGPIGRPAGRPYKGITLFLPKNGLPALYHTRYRARPVQEMIPALWFLRITALLPGRAMPEIQETLQPLAEK